MWEQFWVQNINYVIQVFIAFWMITACWIYLDGWLVERMWRTFIRSMGFFVLTIWAFLGAVPTSVLSKDSLFLVNLFTDISGLLGFGLVLASLLIDPIPIKPGETQTSVWRKVARLHESLRSSLQFNAVTNTSASPPPLPDEILKAAGIKHRAGWKIFKHWRNTVRAWIKADTLPPPPPEMPGMMAIVFESASDLRMFIQMAAQRIFAVSAPVVAIILAVITEPKLWMLLFSATTTTLLWLHYVKGIQSEWKYFYRGFLWVSVALLLSLTSLWQDTQNVLIQNLLAPFHTIWILEHGIKLVGAILLGMWAWGFIRFRLFPQILSSFVAFTFVIFMSTTIIYTGFLLQRMQDDAVIAMAANIKTVDFALGKIKDSAILVARVASINPQLKEAVRLNNQEALYQNLNALVFENETDFMLVANTGGEILMRAEDRDRFGDSIADDPILWRALDGKAVVTTTAEQGATIPTVSIRAASPIVDTSEAGDPEIIGVVITGFMLDTAFVDGIKKITDLEITVFADNVRSATTLVVPESEFRLIGTQELNQEIIDTVLKKGETFTGTTRVLSRPFLAAYIPIKDIEETEIGMFFTGRSHASILAAAGETMQLTFVVSIALMIFALFILWWIARFISEQQRV